ncbi:MAG: hypothetical protein ABIF71_09160 [Planctomycetota bacterium]
MTDAILDPNDPEVLKRALKAFRKRMKTTRLDDESRIRPGALSGGSVSGVVAIRPPHQYPQAVWDELVKQGKLIKSNHLYELPPTQGGQP